MLDKPLNNFVHMTSHSEVNLNRLCVAVAKLSKALAWLSFVRSHERPEFKA